MADEKTPPNQANSSESKPAKAAAKPKAEKPPAPEDKPFEQFIQQDFLPSLETALQDNGIADINLSFACQPLAVPGAGTDQYWQVKGLWQGGGRQFNIAFTDADIKSQKVFYLADQGAKPSTIEQFMGDERKITLDLMVLYTLQRLNGQKWLTRN